MSLVGSSDNPGITRVSFYVLNRLVKLRPRLSVLFGDRCNSQLEVLRFILDVVSEVLYQFRQTKLELVERT